MSASGLRHLSPSKNGWGDSPLQVAGKGALAGFAGTLVLSIAVKGSQWVASRAQDGDRQLREREEQSGIGPGQALAGGQVQAPFLDQSTELFVQKVATGLFGMSLSSDTTVALGVTMHVVYGSFWGGLYGLIQATLQLPAAIHGLLYGIIVWMIGPVTLVPAMEIMPPLRKQGTRKVLMVAGFHVAYGLVLGLAFDAFTRRERQ